MKNQRWIGALVCASALAAGCGGGSGSAVTYPAATAAPLEAVRFSVAVPSSGSSARHREYIPSGAQSVTIQLVAVPPASPAPLLVIELASGSSDCIATSGGTTCSGTMTVAAGQQQFVVSTYAGANGGGAQLSTGAITVQVSATAQNGLTLNNSVSLTLNSIVASIALSVSPSELNVSADQAISISLNAYDATGALIIGPGNFAEGPVFVDIPDPNPFFTGLDGPLVASFVAPGPSQRLAYKSAALYTYPQGGPLTFTATGVGVAPATATLNFLPAPSGTPLVTPTPGATLTPVPTYTPVPTASPSPTPVPQFGVTPNTITFAGAAPQPAQTFTASESGVTSFTAVSQNTSIASVSGNGGSTFTVTAGNTPGQTDIVVSDPSNRQATVTVIVSGQIIIISAKGRHQP